MGIFQSYFPGAWAIYLGPLRFRRLPRLWSLHWRDGWHLCVSFAPGSALPKHVYVSSNGSPPHDTNRGFSLYSHQWRHRLAWWMRARWRRWRA